MSYRDEGEAALQRVENLQQQVTEQHEENQQLQERLAKANAEIVRLHGQPVATTLPIPAVNTFILRALLGIAIAGLVPLFLAAYKSETLGMAAAMVTLPSWGAVLGSWLARRRSTGQLLLISAGSALMVFAVLVVFFGTIWRSL